MPDLKVLGSVSTDTCKKLVDLCVNKNTKNAQEVVSAIVQVVKADLTKISADAYDEPFETNWLTRLDYENPTGLFYMIGEGSCNIHLGKKVIEMEPGKVYFIDERGTWKIESMNKTRVSLISGRFTWNKETHGH